MSSDSTDPTSLHTTEAFERGLAVRRAVLGDAYVDRAFEEMSEFSRPVQELVTEACWGGVWAREGLDRRTRSLLNIGMLTALGIGRELETHVRGALTNGATETEIQETLLQAAVYCGFPLALEAFRRAEAAIAVARTES